jgi:hypothetical protein
MLAYDASCGTCRSISHSVAQACGGRLIVVPLGRREVRAWRAQALGDEAPWAPTLLRVDDNGVDAWTGPAMALPLVRRIGPRAVFRVVYALGRLRSAEQLLPGTRPATRGTGAAFSAVLRLCAGAATAARLLLTGKPPVAAAQENATALRWATKNKDRLPRNYKDVLAYPVAYQKAIFAVSPPRIKSQLWVAALSRDRAERTGLTPEQREVFDRAVELAADERLFDAVQEREPGLGERLSELKTDAARVFTHRAQYSLILTLGKTRVGG